MPQSPSFQFLPPIPLSFDLSELSRDTITSFYKKHQQSAFKIIDMTSDGAYYLERHNNTNTVYAIKLFSPQGAVQNNYDDWAALYLEILNEDGDSLPSQLIVGNQFEGLFPYKMTCCPVFSAVVIKKDKQGRQNPWLLQPELTRSGQQDPFSINTPSSRIFIDSGSKIAHVHAHITGKHEHSCKQHHLHQVIPR